LRGPRRAEVLHSCLTNFIDDPKSGGRAAGVRPINVGFRIDLAPSQSMTAPVVGM